jgi:hypothetical protein
MHPPTLSLAARSPDLEDLIEKARAYIHAAKSPATLRAYRTDFEDFTRFCVEHDLPHLPASPTTVALYIADRASSLRSATITRRLTSITKAHQAAGFEASPSSSHHFVVSETLKGIRRSIGTAQAGKAPLLTSDIRRIVACCPKTLGGLRDQALILVGFAAPFAARSLPRSTTPTSLSPKTASSSTCAARRPTRRQPAARSAFPLGRRKEPARSARCAAGWPRRASPPVPSFAGSIAMASSPAAGFIRTASAGS